MRLSALLWPLLSCAVAGCSGTDETRLLGPGRATRSTLDVLSEPESVDTLCRLVGVSSRVALGGSAGCQTFVAQCNDTVSGIIEVAADASEEPEDDAGDDVDLEPVLGCSVTAAELDACVAQIIERGRSLYGAEVRCDATALPEVELSELALAPACLVVALNCPELIALGEL